VPTSKTYVIAEAGSCHGGDYVVALQLAGAAKEAGADALKLQWTSNPGKMALRRHLSNSEVYKHLAFPSWWHANLAQACKARGIDYMCTVYLPEDIAVVAPHVAKFKVSSFEANDIEFLEAHPRDREVIVSCGMDAHPAIHDYWPEKWCLLHCVSGYPTPLEELNLGVVRAGLFRGLSDHTRSLHTGGWAVAAGARIIEKHMRLNSTTSTDPDWLHSLVPRDFRVYVSFIRRAEKAMGDGDKRVMPSESDNLKYRVRS
jgi:N,N'-diacetyllegionaminate synthase